MRVVIPSQIRSLSSNYAGELNLKGESRNPFSNQVVIFSVVPTITREAARRRNPFSNQVVIFGEKNDATLDRIRSVS